MAFAALLVVFCSLGANRLFSQVGYQVLKSFGDPLTAAQNPRGALIEGSDGDLYGTTEYGGFGPYFGAVIRVRADGSGYSVIHRFGRSPSDGRRPQGGVVEGADGFLYGTTESGGLSAGIIFKLRKDGTDYAVIHHFTGGATNGAYPEGPLVVGPDGGIYGCTALGGLYNGGTAFKINPIDGAFSLLHSFERDSGSSDPLGLIRGRDGFLYGATRFGGLYRGGRIYRLNGDGTGYTHLRSFIFLNTINEGRYPTGLTEASDGNLYGAAAAGGTNRAGVVFRLTKQGDYAELHHFPSNTWLRTPLIEGPDHALYGGDNQRVFRIDTNGSNFTVVHVFDEPYGVNPLLMGRDGALYGSTWLGGQFGDGLIFRLETNGVYGVLSHLSRSGADAASPNGPLVEGPADYLYGISEEGGPGGGGTVFRIRKDGSDYAIVAQFGTTNRRMVFPTALLSGKDGHFYGTTSYGGDSNRGSIFRFTPGEDSLALLHSFSGPDGAEPGELIRGRDGMLYGTVWSGTASDGGGVFRIGPEGNGFSVLCSFTPGGTNVYSPGSLMQASDGLFYGTAQGGKSDSGTIFSLDPATGRTVLLHSSTNLPAEEAGGTRLIERADGFLYGTHAARYDEIFRIAKDGSGYAVLRQVDPIAPSSGLIEGDDGLLYGTGLGGSTFFGGVVFRLSSDATQFEVLHNFGDWRDGNTPNGHLLQASDGNLYGVTSAGGECGAGTLFRITTASLTRLMVNTSPTGTHLSWNGISGVHYRVQHTLSVAPNAWTEFTNDIISGSFTARMTDGETPEEQRFYRVKVLPPIGPVTAQ